MNALTAASGIIIPVQTQKFALDGLQGLNQVYKQVKNSVNQGLSLIGILATMVENTNMSKTTEKKLAERYEEFMFKTVIHKSVNAAYSVQNGASLCMTNGSKLGAEYIRLADEVIERLEWGVV